ncbi:MAG: nucleotide sugar dehydrogenase [Flavobacteriales bacterium]|nr:nucleotide sugar dehydrogenase [Flavobacteriales bacterium]NNK80884.1 nucleotide sugar dehydrogenase [Flavobacteriales bacterium]
MKIGVLGLGYVGIVNVACLSKEGFTILCNDVKPQKVNAVRSGRSPIHEPQVDDLINDGLSKGTIIPMDDSTELIRQSDIIITCVGTPSKDSGEVNLDYLNNVVYEISENVGKQDRKFLVFRSTVPPGTTEKIFDKYLSDTEIIPVFYPEFLREGSAVRDFYDYGRFVLGKRENDEVSELVDILHVNKERPSFVTDLRTSEYSKYIDNSFHALKIVFANEIFSLGAELGVNVKDAHAIFTADDKLNISKRYLRPGLPFGGSCLPKDLRELQYLISSSNQEFALIPSMIPSNDAYVDSLLEKVKSFDAKKIGFIGLSFKNDSDDLRESPMLRILDRLNSTKEYEFSIWDEDLKLDNLRIDFPYLFRSVKDLDDCIADSDLLIVSKRYLDKVLKKRREGQFILNFSDEQYPSDSTIESLYQ